jgi:branched-chain amino acid transport system permease protein
MELSIFIQLIVLGLVRGSMYALMGVGLSLIFGIMQIVNFAHGELFMIGCYIMYFVAAMLGLLFPLGILAAGIGVFIVGIILEKGLISTLRKKAGREWLMDSFVLTIGLMVIFQNLALIIFGSIQRGIPNPNAGMAPVLKSFVVVILGGLGNIKGAIAAGILVGLLEAYAVFFLAGGWQNVIVFSIVIAVLVFKPSGLFAPAGERP